MAITRSGSGSSPTTTPKDGAGTKRKADPVTSPTAKKGKKLTPKKQKKLEETLGKKVIKDCPNDSEMLEAEAEVEGGKVTKKGETNGKKTEDVGAENKIPGNETKAGAEEAKDEASHEQSNVNKASDDTVNGVNGAIKHSEQKSASNIIEKSVIYFFTRARVAVEEPESVQDLQRTHMVLRPLLKDAKLGEGPMPDLKNNRLIAIPKKVLPKTPKDRFMAFVEKANTTIDDLKENFFARSEHETKTLGVHENSPVTPVSEGVYAITTQGASTHLVYLLTIPEHIGEVQNDLGIRTQGSFALSLKNPTIKGPANAQLDQPAEFSQDIIDEFRGRSWMSISRPDHLDYENAQFLLLGEGEDGFDKATEQTSKDERAGKDTPAEEVEKLEHEDEIRVKKLHGDNTVFADLGLSHKDYPKVMTTW